MAVAKEIKNALNSQSMIRKMFEEGARLKAQYGADKVFDFSLGNPDLEPPEAFHKTLLKCSGDRDMHGYMPNAGYPDVRKAIARKASREQGAALQADDIIMSVGAAGALNVIFKSILNAGDEVIVTKPYFMEYRSYIGNSGGKIVEVAADSAFNPDIKAIEAAVSAKTAAILINSPNNPTGVVYDADVIKALSGVLENCKAKTGRFPYLIADEPYREIVFCDAQTPPVIKFCKNSIVATSYSKSLSLAGERIGYIAVSPDADEKENLQNALIYATRILGFVNAPALMQRCVAELGDVSVDILTYKKRRDTFLEVLDYAGLSYIKPEGAFYIFAKVPPRGASGGSGASGAAGDDKAFSDVLKKHLILAVPGSGFSCAGWIRFAFCVHETIIKNSREAFKKAVCEWTA